MDLTASIEPKSDQLNAEDLLTGPMTYTIETVNEGSDEQPVNIHLVERPGRPWRPSKSMRRVLVSAWGKDSNAYVGKRVTLYRDPEVTFGRDKVGGIKVSHLSDIDKPLNIALTVTRGKRAMTTVQPLRESAPSSIPTEPTAAEVAACTDDAQLREWWKAAGPERRAQIEARGKELKAAATPTPADEQGALIGDES